MYGIAPPSPVPRLNSTPRDFVISQVQSILTAFSGLTEQTINVLLEAHRKNPHALAEHFKIELRTKQAVKTRTFVEIMTRKMKPEKPSYSVGMARPGLAFS